MMKEEFEELIGKSVSDAEYSVIETVYTWHPAISETEGKKQITSLYTQFGMAVINGMFEGAIIAQNLDGELRAAKAKLQAIQDRTKSTKSGDFQFEKCRMDVETAFEDSESSEEYQRQLRNLKKKYIPSLVDEAIVSLGKEVR